MAPQMLATESPGTLTFPVPEPAAGPVMARRWGFARGRLAALLLVVVVCAINLGETALEGRWSAAMTARGLEFASALHWLEGHASFENESVRDVVSVYGFSLAYFVLFPLIVVATAWALARKPNPQAFRAFAFALVIDYVCSVPFFLLFPVPERWSYPDAGAILLSDLWDSRLIEAFRPMSALDNCFPSFHTSMTVIVLLCCFIYRVGFRVTMIPLAAMVTMSTYTLGVHWAGDVIAGTALGVISVAAGCRLADRGAPVDLDRPTSALMGPVRGV